MLAKQGVHFSRSITIIFVVEIFIISVKSDLHSASNTGSFWKNIIFYLVWKYLFNLIFLGGSWPKLRENLVKHPMSVKKWESEGWSPYLKMISKENTLKGRQPKRRWIHSMMASHGNDVTGWKPHQLTDPRKTYLQEASS